MPLLFGRFLNEAEVDGQPVGEEQQPEDYTDTGEQGQPTEPPAEGQTGDVPPENMPPEDYTVEDMPDQGGEAQDAGGAPPPPQDQQDAEVDDLKKQEEELYSELSPEQLDIKHKELKTQYLNMYDTVVSIIDRVGDINVAEENIGVLEYVSNTLASLKDMLSDYVNDVYKTKSYIENSINYNRFLATLNAINRIFEEMNSKNDKN